MGTPVKRENLGQTTASSAEHSQIRLSSESLAACFSCHTGLFRCIVESRFHTDWEGRKEGGEQG